MRRLSRKFRELRQLISVGAIGGMFTFFFPGLTYAQSAYTVPAGGATSLTTAGSGSSISVGYGRLQVSSGAAPGGFAVFGFRLGGILVNESAVPASGRLSAGRIYAELSESVNTGLAIANPSPQTATITFYFTDSSGNSTTSRTMTLGPNGQTAKFLSQDPFNGTSPFRGSFTFSSSVPVSVIALRGLSNQRGDFLITALPVADLNTSITDSLIFPHYADGGGWTTQIVLVNPSNQSIAGTIRFSNPVGVVSSPDTISTSTGTPSDRCASHRGRQSLRAESGMVFAGRSEAIPGIRGDCFVANPAPRNDAPCK